MKIFKNWKENDVASFLMFLAIETKKQKRKMREYYKKVTSDADPNMIHIYHVQQGYAVEASTIYILAKESFGFTNRKNKKNDN
jgi:hypothetical protein